MEQDSSSMEKRFSYKFLKRVLQYVDSAQEFIAHLGGCEIVQTGGLYITFTCALSWHVDLLLIQRQWLQVGRRTNHLMTRKSNSLPRSGGSAARVFMRVMKYCSNPGLVLPYNSALQVLLPLIDQTFKNHCLYFLSTPSKNLSSCGCASNKEKEMVTR